MRHEHSGIRRPIFLESRQIVLRDLGTEDVTPAYVNWMNDSEVVQYTESRFSKHTMESIKSFVLSCCKNPAVVLFGMFSKESGTHIGNIKLGPINWYHGLADLALIIGSREFWGRGIASEAITLVSRYAFLEFHLNKITAGCYSTNKASGKAFLKSGFTIEAVRPRHYRCGNQLVDGVELGLLNPGLPPEPNQ